MHINSSSKSQGSYAQEKEKNWGHSPEIKLVIRVMYFNMYWDSEQFNFSDINIVYVGRCLYYRKNVVSSSYFDISENNGSCTGVQLSNNPWENGHY